MFFFYLGAISINTRKLVNISNDRYLRPFLSTITAGPAGMASSQKITTCINHLVHTYMHDHGVKNVEGRSVAGTCIIF